MQEQSKDKQCPLCKAELRPKKQSDWKKGEKTAKGYYPKTTNYKICTNKRCKRTWLQQKQN